MADEAFALSPISARATLPSEADYDAIREAFMETTRGRWFLGEYAKRNRNADTSMVLDAVSRIEQALATQRQPVEPESKDSGLADALAAIRVAVEQAEQAAHGAFDAALLEQNLAPIRRGTRIIKEISWRWREIGADPRICDLIDSQVDAIDAGCVEIAQIDPRPALSTSFEIIKQTLEQFIHDDDAVAEEEAELVSSTAEHQPQATDTSSVAEQLEPETETTDAQDIATTIMEASAADEVALEPEPDIAASESHEPVAADAELTAEEIDAEDKAMLDLVASEMAAPDSDAAYDHFGIFADTVDDPEPLTPEPVAVAPEPVMHPGLRTPALHPALQASLQPVIEPAPQRMPAATPWPAPAAVVPQAMLIAAVAQVSEHEPSLGSTILANGILPRPAANDPLAPLRRMSQAEKIAFFS
jgi:hypothetical protein